MNSGNSTLRDTKNKQMFSTAINTDTFSKLNRKCTDKDTFISSNRALSNNSNKIHLNRENVRVIVRIRPFYTNRNSESLQSCVRVINGESGKKKILLEDPRHRALPKSYEFDEIYNTDSRTEYIYSNEVKNFVNPLLTKCTCINVFAFGSSGTGKTYTMHGDKDEVGIVGLTIKQLIEINNNQVTPGKFSFSFFEVYCEKIRDLLSGINGVNDSVHHNGDVCSSNKVCIRTDICGRIRVVGTIKHEFSTWDDFYKVYQQALKKRTSGETAVNSVSSRSHACIQVNYIPPISNTNDEVDTSVGEDTIENRKRRGSISFHVKPKININYPRTIVNLIDLSGFENNKITNNSGKRMIESTFINSSLLSLSKVFNALKRSGGTQTSQNCIPYRESKLTRLLQEYLGGGADPPYSPYCLRCIMICTISPSTTFFQQTYATLNTPTYGNKTGMAKYVGIFKPKIKEKHLEANNESSSATRDDLDRKSSVISLMNPTSRINKKKLLCSSVSKTSLDIKNQIPGNGTEKLHSTFKTYKNVESKVAQMIKGEMPFHSKSHKTSMDKLKSLDSLRRDSKKKVNELTHNENSKDINVNILNTDTCERKTSELTSYSLGDNIITCGEELDLVSCSLDPLTAIGTPGEGCASGSEVESMVSNSPFDSENKSGKCNVKYNCLLDNTRGESRENKAIETVSKEAIKSSEIVPSSSIIQSNDEKPGTRSVNRPVTRSQTKRR